MDQVLSRDVPKLMNQFPPERYELFIAGLVLFLERVLVTAGLAVRTRRPRVLLLAGPPHRRHLRHLW